MINRALKYTLKKTKSYLARSTLLVVSANSFGVAAADFGSYSGLQYMRPLAHGNGVHSLMGIAGADVRWRPVFAAFDMAVNLEELLFDGSQQQPYELEFLLSGQLGLTLTKADRFGLKFGFGGILAKLEGYNDQCDFYFANTDSSARCQNLDDYNVGWVVSIGAELYLGGNTHLVLTGSRYKLDKQLHFNGITLAFKIKLSGT